MATKKDDKICLCCGQSFSDTKMYKSRSGVINEHYSLCKVCATTIANQNTENMHYILRLLDIPFIPEVHKDCEGSENLFSQYILRMNNPKKKFENGKTYSELRYDDSPTLQMITDVDNYIYATNEQLGDYRALFGDSWNKEELVTMNKELTEMFVKYGGKREDIAILDVYTEVILTKWLSRKAYNSGDAKTGRELSKRRSELLKENGLSLSDIKDKQDGEALGCKIDFSEDRPIIPEKKYHDVDGIRFMFDKLIKHMERFVGVDKSSVDDDYVEMQQYVDEHGSYVDELE